MICPNCGNEKFEVIKVFRNKKIDKSGKHYFSNTIDTRKVICNDCLSVFYTETSLKFKKTYNSKLLKSTLQDANQMSIFL